jgi:hypothetical protein
MRGALGSLMGVAPEPGLFKAQTNRRSPTLAHIAADAQRRLRRAEEALAEQRILTREADHRVANALQLVHGTLSLQATAAPEGEVTSPHRVVRAEF